jgi:hypothetical protein
MWNVTGLFTSFSFSIRKLSQKASLIYLRLLDILRAFPPQLFPVLSRNPSESYGSNMEREIPGIIPMMNGNIRAS